MTMIVRLFGLRLSLRELAAVAVFAVAMMGVLAEFVGWLQRIG